MRLNDRYRKVIVEVLHKHFGENADLYLFGSRADDSKKGGDIDLYIETDEVTADDVLSLRSKAYIDMIKVLGEQKIDIIVHVKGTAYSPIKEIAKATGVLL